MTIVDIKPFVVVDLHSTKRKAGIHLRRVVARLLSDCVGQPTAGKFMSVLQL